MSKVTADITMSLDGFITGPGDRPGRGLGERGECLHNWVMGGPWHYDDEGRRFAPGEVDRRVLSQAMASIGAGIIGRRMFDVTDGIGSALAQARAVAGDKDVGIGGGANVIQQYLAAGLVDELRLHVAPVLLGTGKRLFDHLGDETIELARTAVIESPYATHLYFTVCRLPHGPKSSSSEICAPFWTLLAVKLSSTYWPLVPDGSGMVTVFPVAGLKV